VIRLNDSAGTHQAWRGPVAPVDYSIVSAAELGRVVASSYAFGFLVSCDLLARSLHDTYLLRSSRGRYLIRLYRANWRPVHQIAWEIELSLHLATNGVPVSVPLEAIDGARFRSVRAAEGARHLMVFDYPAGSHLKWTDSADCELAGEVLATIHEVSDGFPNADEGPRTEVTAAVSDALATLRLLPLHHSAAVHELESLTDMLLDRLMAAMTAFESGVCHGDFTHKAVRIQEDRRFLVDLLRPSFWWRASDFVDMRWAAVCGKGQWDAFVEGYRRVRRAPDLDASVYSLVHAARQLTQLEFLARRVDESGLLKIERQIEEVSTILREDVREDASDTD
jgi:Ser/Thr protein kinase RdoA (MazF antagonist)